MPLLALAICYLRLFISAISFSHILTCENFTILYDATQLALVLHLSVFNCFTFFKFEIPRQKSDKTNSIRIIFVKVIIKIVIIKIYTKKTHFITTICDISKIFIKIDYILICVQNSIKSFNHFTCNKPIGNKSQCC